MEWTYDMVFFNPWHCNKQYIIYLITWWKYIFNCDSVSEKFAYEKTPLLFFMKIMASFVVRTKISPEAAMI